MDMDTLSDSLKQMIGKAGDTFILDGHYSHELLDVNLIDHVFVLRRAPWRLIEILQNRLYSYEKVWENLEAEIIGVILGEVIEQYPPEKVHETDTTEMTQEDTAIEILKVISGEKATNVGPIDWIVYPETLRLLVNKTCILS